MLPQPLHPAVVHFPLVLAFLLPIFALGALWAIRRGAATLRIWTIPLLFAAALTGSAWVGLQTGEAEEDRVEAVVGDDALHEHEEAAERFFVLSGVLLLLAGAGLIRGTVGASARLLATAGALALTLVAVNVGAAGGELVYTHGAANAYAGAAADGAAGLAEVDEDDDDRAVLVAYGLYPRVNQPRHSFSSGSSSVRAIPARSRMEGRRRNGTVPALASSSAPATRYQPCVSPSTLPAQ